MICIFWCFKRAAHYLRLSQSVYSIMYSKKKWLLFIPSNLCHCDREVLVTSFLSLGIPFLPQQHMGIKKCNQSIIMASIWIVLGFLEPYSKNWKMHAVAKGLYSESKSEGQCGERAGSSEWDTLKSPWFLPRASFGGFRKGRSWLVGWSVSGLLFW